MLVFIYFLICTFNCISQLIEFNLLSCELKRWEQGEWPFQPCPLPMVDRLKLTLILPSKDNKKKCPIRQLMQNFANIIFALGFGGMDEIPRIILTKNNVQKLRPVSGRSNNIIFIIIKCLVPPFWSYIQKQTKICYRV